MWSTWDWKLSPDMSPKPFPSREKINYTFPGVGGVSNALNLLPCVLGSWALLCFVDVTCPLILYETCYVGFDGIQRLRRLYGSPIASRRVYTVTFLFKLKILLASHNFSL